MKEAPLAGGRGRGAKKRSSAMMMLTSSKRSMSCTSLSPVRQRKKAAKASENSSASGSAENGPGGGGGGGGGDGGGYSEGNHSGADSGAESGASSYASYDEDGKKKKRVTKYFSTDDGTELCEKSLFLFHFTSNFCFGWDIGCEVLFGLSHFCVS